MYVGILIRGVAIGFSIAVPVGPISMLYIQRTLLRGKKSGIVSGLSAAIADAVYGSIAGFGLTFIADVLISWQFWMRLLGGFFLCYLGIRIALSKLAEQENRLSKENIGREYGSTFILTMANPLTILSFATIFGIRNTFGSILWMHRTLRGGHIPRFCTMVDNLNFNLRPSQAKV